MCKKYVDVIEKHFNRKLNFAKKISSLIPRRENIKSRFAEGSVPEIEDERNAVTAILYFSKMWL